MTVVYRVYETLIGSLYSQRLRSSDMLFTKVFDAFLVLFHNIWKRLHLPELDIESASSTKFWNDGILIFSRTQCPLYSLTRPFSFEYTIYDSGASVTETRNGNLNRIFGGRDATRGEVPWQVNLLMDGKNLKNLHCGGTLISSTVRFLPKEWRMLDTFNC